MRREALADLRVTEEDRGAGKPGRLCLQLLSVHVVRFDAQVVRVVSKRQVVVEDRNAKPRRLLSRARHVASRDEVERAPMVRAHSSSYAIRIASM
jgi:hypothetical protein